MVVFVLLVFNLYYLLKQVKKNTALHEEHREIVEEWLSDYREEGLRQQTNAEELGLFGESEEENDGEEDNLGEQTVDEEEDDSNEDEDELEVEQGGSQVDKPTTHLWREASSEPPEVMVKEKVLFEKSPPVPHPISTESISPPPLPPQSFPENPLLLPKEKKQIPITPVNQLRVRSEPAMDQLVQRQKVRPVQRQGSAAPEHMEPLVVPRRKEIGPAATSSQPGIYFSLALSLGFNMEIIKY